MTYSKLLELIQQMSPEQKEMDVLICINGENHSPQMLSEIVHNDDEEEDALPLGQPVLI